MPRTEAFDDRLPRSTAILSNIALALVLWNLTLRFLLLVARWTGGGML
jgi:hypothetical protein